MPWRVVIRERGGKTLPGVFASESQALSFIRSRVAKETVLHAYEAAAGMIFMPVSKCAASTIRRLTADGASTNWG